jgi:hypothetical protein
MVINQNPYGVEKCTVSLPEKTAFDMLSLGVAFVDKLIRIDSLSDRFEKNFERIVSPYYGKTIEGSNEELYALFKTIEDDIVGEFVIPIVNDCAVMIYFGALSKKAQGLGISSEELNKYISNQGDVRALAVRRSL